MKEPKAVKGRKVTPVLVISANEGVVKRYSLFLLTLKKNQL